MFLETAVAGCYSLYWTAGKRADSNPQSEYVWRVGAQVYPMAFHKFDVNEPSYNGQCVHIWESNSYSWNDLPCTSWQICSVCEFGRQVQ